jgi:hypothetical protein
MATDGFQKPELDGNEVPPREVDCAGEIYEMGSAPKAGQLHELSFRSLVELSPQSPVELPHDSPTSLESLHNVPRIR